MPYHDPRKIQTGLEGAIPTVLAESRQWLVVNKPAFWLSISATPQSTPQPTPDVQKEGESSGESLSLASNSALPVVVDWAREHFGPIWVVHRLDVQTSGVLLFARSAEDHAYANQWFESRQVRKVYGCLVAGTPPPILKLNTPIRGKPSQTQIEAPEVFGVPHSYVQARPLTGRRHQIRIHLSQAGYPIWGDAAYGGPVSPQIRGMEVSVPRVALHALSLELPTREVFQAPLPVDFKTWLGQLRGDLK